MSGTGSARRFAGRRRPGRTLWTRQHRKFRTRADLRRTGCGWCKFDEGQKVVSGACRVLGLLCYGRDDETRVALPSTSWITRLAARFMALVLTIAPTALPVQAAEDAPKVSVVSFGLFGDQG